MKRTFYILFSLLVTLGIFTYLFQSIDFEQVVEMIRGVDKKSIAIFLLLSFTMSLCRTWQFQLLLSASKQKVSSIALFLIVIVRNFFSDLLPARLGTLIYVYLVNTRLGVSFPVAASSFSLGFLFDILAVVPLILLAAVLASSDISFSAILLGAAVLTLILAVLVAALPKMIDWGVLVARKLGFGTFHLFDELLNGLSGTSSELRKIGTPWLYIQLLIISGFIRVAKYSAFYYLLYGFLKPFGMTLAQLPPAKVFLGLSAAELSASLPISGIAGFGAYEGAWALSFHLLGFEQELAKLTGISHHLFTQIYGYSIGGIALLILLLPFFGKNTASSQGGQLHFLHSRKGFAALCTLALGAFATIYALSPKVLEADLHHKKINATPEQIAAKKRFLAESGLEIFFDSNTYGTFGIFYFTADGQMKTLVDTAQHEMYPDPSPDGRFVVYARSKYLGRQVASDIWWYDREKNKTEKITKNGTYPRFTPDGKGISFERKRRKVMYLDLETRKVKKIFPKKKSPFLRYEVVKPLISPDGEWVAFSSDRVERWSAWIANLKTGEALRMGKGCEPTWFANSQDVLWVNKTEANAGSGFNKFHRKSETASRFLDEGAPYGHEYFPSLVENDRYLFHSACPPDEHDHERSGYELFVWDAKGGELIQLTFHAATSRFPRARRR